MACVSKIGSLYEMVTKNVIVSTTNTIFGIRMASRRSSNVRTSW